MLKYTGKIDDPLFKMRIDKSDTVNPSQNRFRRQTEDIKPMPMSAQSERILYQVLHFDTEKS